MYFTVQYHPGLPDIKGTLKKYLPILYTSERMSRVFSRPPVVSFSQSKNLSQQLCRAKLQVPQKEAIQSKPCQGNRCQLCTAFVSASCVTSNSNGRTFHCCNQGTNCNTKWAVYVIMCDVCGLQYVGQTNNIVVVVVVRPSLSTMTNDITGLNKNKTWCDESCCG